MGSFENPFMHKMDDLEVGSRPRGDQESQSYFDESYVKLKSRLETTDKAEFLSALEHLSDDTKEKLSHALNNNDERSVTWEYLAKISKKDTDKAAKLIYEWAKNRSIPMDAAAERKIDTALVEAIYALDFDRSY